MRFDHTFIAIRQRNIFEIFDLALHVFRLHAPAITVLSLVGILPFAILNHLLIGWMISDEYYLTFQPYYGWLMIMLVTIQAQISTTLVSYYLGQATFVGRPGIASTIKAVLAASGKLIWIHGVLRLLIPLMLLVIPVSFNQSVYDAGSRNFICFAVLPLGVAAMLLIRMFRPFASEIAVLEKTPFFDDKQVTYKVRSSSLHNSGSGMLFSRGLVGILFAIPICYMMYTSCYFVRSVFWMNWDVTRYVTAYCFVPALWLTAIYMAIVRFLSYIDLRIRQEGWEVELSVRAEAIQLAESI